MKGSGCFCSCLWLFLTQKCAHWIQKVSFILLKIGADHILWEQVDSFKEETKMMVMGLTEGLQIEICHLLSHLHQHIKKSRRFDEK